MGQFQRGGRGGGGGRSGGGGRGFGGRGGGGGGFRSPRGGNRGTMANGSGGGSAPSRFNRGGGDQRGMNKFGGSPWRGGGGGNRDFRGGPRGRVGGRGRGRGNFNKFDTPQRQNSKFDDEEGSENEDEEMESDSEEQKSSNLKQNKTKPPKQVEKGESEDDEDEDEGEDDDDDDDDDLSNEDEQESSPEMSDDDDTKVKAEEKMKKKADAKVASKIAKDVKVNGRQESDDDEEESEDDDAEKSGEQKQKSPVKTPEVVKSTLPKAADAAKMVPAAVAQLSKDTAAKVNVAGKPKEKLNAPKDQQLFADKDSDDEDESMDDEDLSDEDLSDEDLSDEDLEDEEGDEDEEEEKSSPVKQAPKPIQAQNQTDKMKQKPESKKRVSSENGNKAATPDTKKSTEPPTKKAKTAVSKPGPAFAVPADKTILNEGNERKKHRDLFSLFVKNLPKKASDDDIKALSADIKVVRRKNQNCRYGWLTFVSEEACVKNYEKLKNATLHDQPIFVDFCGDKSQFSKSNAAEKAMYDINPMVLYVGNLPGQDCVEQLKKCFSSAVNFVFPKFKKSGDRKFAFVHFASAQAAREAFDKSKDLKLDDIPVTVNFAKAMSGGKAMEKKKKH